MVNIQIAGEMVGTVDFMEVGQADHHITVEERSFAIVLAYEMARKYGIDLDADVCANERMLSGEIT